MSTIYWFALILGGGVLAASIFGDLFGGGADGADVAAGGHAGGPGDVDAAKILSLRNASYFLFAFGGTGVALGWIGTPGLITAPVALLVGAVAATAAGLLLGYVRRTDTGARATEASFVGCTGRLTLPFAHEHAGRIVVQRGDREYELRARPFDPRAAAATIGAAVVVVDMEAGTALVAPLEESLPALGEGG